MQKIVVYIVFGFFGTLYSQSYDYQIKNLNLNSKYSDFGVYNENGKFIFASTRPNDNKSSKNWTNGQPHLDLFSGTVGLEVEPTVYGSFSDDVNTKFHESSVAITADGNTLYFTRSNFINNAYGKDQNGWNKLKLLKAKKNSYGEWSEIESLPFNSDDYSCGHPAISPDGKYLYFVSDMPGGYGDTDIYKVELFADGSMNSPTNLGARINSYGKEMFPIIDKDNILYYSSDARGSMGGLDIFSVSLLDNSVQPSRLPEPINSNSDDFAYTFDTTSNKGYFTSNRPGGKGDDDIYYFEISKIESLKKCKQNVSGKIYDTKTNQILPKAQVSLYKDFELLESILAPENGEYKFEDLDCNAHYRIVANKDDYRGDDQKFLTSSNPNKNNSVDLNLSPLKANLIEGEYNQCQQALNEVGTIYFDLDKEYIRTDAADKLEEVVRIMTECKFIVIMATAHTDSRGSDLYNQDLSQRRAQSMVDYIVKRGIDRRRIIAIGKGETELLNRCGNLVKCTEEEHQNNRRTEFIIIR